MIALGNVDCARVLGNRLVPFGVKVSVSRTPGRLFQGVFLEIDCDFTNPLTGDRFAERVAVTEMDATRYFHTRKTAIEYLDRLALDVINQLFLAVASRSKEKGDL